MAARPGLGPHGSRGLHAHSVDLRHHKAKTQGDVLIYGANGEAVVLANPTTDGQVLYTRGAGANVSWDWALKTQTFSRPGPDTSGVTGWVDMFTFAFTTPALGVAPMLCFCEFESEHDNPVIRTNVGITTDASSPSFAVGTGNVLAGLTQFIDDLSAVHPGQDHLIWDTVGVGDDDTYIQQNGVWMQPPNVALTYHVWIQKSGATANDAKIRNFTAWAVELWPNP